MGAHIRDKNQNATNAIVPIQKDVSAPIKMEPINPITIEMIEKIARTGPDAIAAASIGPRLWFKIPHPRIIEAIKRIIIPAVIFSALIVHNYSYGFHDIPLNASSKF
ncbi:MAG: hypothetical protein JRJ39_13450 [Deltaproteobacteria bacterium]|nr:hypothetical protein [Deltaproteobacteria bacterium]